MSLFYLKFFITNILFSLLIGALVVRFSQGKTDREYSTFELVLYSLGLGPMVTVLLLYYLLLLVPKQKTAVYLAVVFLIYLLCAIFARKGFVIIWKGITGVIARARKERDVKTISYWCLIVLLLLTFLWGYTGTVKHNRLEGHDALIYGNFGKIYYQQKKITYAKVMLPTPNGFLFKGSPKPAFSLLYTWELMLNTKTIQKTLYFDTYFRSISGYYGLLIIAVSFLWLFRRNRYLALLGIFLMVSGFHFYIMLIDHHLDSFRIFFLLVSWIWLAYSIKQKDWFSFSLLALFSGFAAFAHVIGLVVALINGLAFFIFYEDSLKQRSIITALFIVIVLALGSFHYVLEALYGSKAGFLNYLSL
ncbi:MAG: hypothetical protein GY940_18765 [bacterium]|nr:hypothetical protein [bacterium]